MEFIDVVGGRLGVHELAAGDGPVVLAAHGITANALSFAALASDLPAGTRLLAPDLRGRACSAGITGPWGVAQHADDLIAVADAYGVDRFTLLGHSMGAFVAAVTALRYPDRVEKVVLVDGGVGLPVPPETDIDALLTAVIGPAMTRLSMSFPDRASFHGLMARNPAVAEVLALDPSAADQLAAYLDHDLVAAPDGTLHSSCVLDAIRNDGAAVTAEPESLLAVRALPVPGTLLWAPRGLMNQTPGLYTEQLLAAAELPDTLRVQEVPDCNHYSIVFADHARRAIVDGLVGR